MATPRTFIVTGSSSGIGLSIARAFVERGDAVVLHGRDASKLQRVRAELNADDRTTTVAGPLEDIKTAEALAHAAIDYFGRIDGLVNNAGIFEPKPFLDVSPADLDRFLAINLRGTYFVTQAAVRRMVETGGGSVTNIGTVLVNHAIGAFPCSAPIVSKGGVQALTTSLAAELAPQGIRVNMVSPGVIRTPLHDSSLVDDYAGLALLNRVGESDEIAHAVLHLVDAAFTTGVILPVDGGHVAGRAA